MNVNIETSYEEDKVYQARIIDQQVRSNFDGQAQIVLTILILAALKDENNPSAGTEECPQQEHEVWLTIVPEAPARLRMVIRDLVRLGFDEDDISRLHPDHPHFFSVLDKEVLVRTKAGANGNVYWNLAWPRPKPMTVEALGQVASPLRESIAALKKARGKKSTRATPGANNQEAQS